jgi:hypothetical protein
MLNPQLEKYLQKEGERERNCDDLQLTQTSGNEGLLEIAAADDSGVYIRKSLHYTGLLHPSRSSAWLLIATMAVVFSFISTSTLLYVLLAILSLLFGHYVLILVQDWHYRREETKQQHVVLRISFLLGSMGAPPIQVAAQRQSTSKTTLALLALERVIQNHVQLWQATSKTLEYLQRATRWHLHVGANVERVEQASLLRANRRNNNSQHTTLPRTRQTLGQILVRQQQALICAIGINNNKASTNIPRVLTLAWFRHEQKYVGELVSDLCTRVLGEKSLSTATLGRLDTLELLVANDVAHLRGWNNNGRAQHALDNNNNDDLHRAVAHLQEQAKSLDAALGSIRESCADARNVPSWSRIQELVDDLIVFNNQINQTFFGEAKAAEPDRTSGNDLDRSSNDDVLTSSAIEYAVDPMLPVVCQLKPISFQTHVYSGVGAQQLCRTVTPAILPNDAKKLPPPLRPCTELIQELQYHLQFMQQADEMETELIQKSQAGEESSEAIDEDSCCLQTAIAPGLFLGELSQVMAGFKAENDDVAADFMEWQDG